MAGIAKRQRQRSSKSQRRQLRQRRARKARAARRQLRQRHERLPKAARSLFETFRPAFAAPTYYRFASLLCAALLTVGNHTVCDLLRTPGAVVPGHPSS